MHLQKRDGVNAGMVAGPIVFAVIFLSAAALLYYKKRWPKSVLYVPKKQKPNPSKPNRLLNFFRHGFKNPNPHHPPSDQETAYEPSTHSTTDTRDPSITEMTTNTPTSTHPTRDRGSLRSILTLPTYHPSPLPNEQLIAREGERAGLDTIISYPETASEEEARREADMAALYSIRQARRREIDERNDRRRARADARAQGDYARLEQFRLEDLHRQRARVQQERERSGSGSGSSLTLLPSSSLSTIPDFNSVGGGGNASSQSLIAEHNARTSSRDRRVSSVSYADLGLARHDGSRLRENSVDSDHRPLLESAAFMGQAGAGGGDGSSNHSRRGSSAVPAARNESGNGQHHRGASAESVATTSSDLMNAGAGAAAAVITPQTSSGDRSGSDPVGLTPSGSGSEPSPPLPGEDPPGYEDAPPYESPVAGRGEGGGRRWPSLRVESGGGNGGNEGVPRIEIEVSTPVGERPVD